MPDSVGSFPGSYLGSFPGTALSATAFRIQRARPINKFPRPSRTGDFMIALRNTLQAVTIGVTGLHCPFTDRQLPLDIAAEVRSVRKILRSQNTDVRSRISERRYDERLPHGHRRRCQRAALTLLFPLFLMADLTAAADRDTIFRAPTALVSDSGIGGQPAQLALTCAALLTLFMLQRRPGGR